MLQEAKINCRTAVKNKNIKHWLKIKTSSRKCIPCSFILRLPFATHVSVCLGGDDNDDDDDDRLLFQRHGHVEMSLFGAVVCCRCRFMWNPDRSSALVGESTANSSYFLLQVCQTMTHVPRFHFSNQKSSQK